ncbi:MAG: hypothetical protein AB7E32_13060 [Desulfovibrio sp.]
MKHFLPISLLTLLLAALTLVAAWKVPPASAVQPAEASFAVNAQFVVARCGHCHGLDKTCAKLGKKDQDAWLRTVKRMVEAHGTDIVPATANDVAAYLAGPDAALTELCGN